MGIGVAGFAALAEPACQTVGNKLGACPDLSGLQEVRWIATSTSAANDGGIVAHNTMTDQQIFAPGPRPLTVSDSIFAVKISADS